jgi:RNA polymerase sigma-70 factor (ECF subfamily)
VRNTWYSRFPKRGGDRTIELDDTAEERPGTDLDPEARVIQQQAVERVRLALEQLPPDFREVVVLRELEGFSYKEIATIVDIPIGTVMSRLARARERLIPILRSSEQPIGESCELS